MRIEIAGLEPLLAAFKKAKVELPDQFRRAMVASVLDIQREARSMAPLDTKALKLSISTNVETNPLIGRVYVGQRYGLFVERGTRPHFPPIKAITPWALRHGISPWAVARSIARKGTKPQPFMQPAFIKSHPKVREYFRRAAVSVVKMLAGGR